MDKELYKTKRLLMELMSLNRLRELPFDLGDSLLKEREAFLTFQRETIKTLIGEYILKAEGVRNKIKDIKYIGGTPSIKYIQEARTYENIIKTLDVDDDIDILKVDLSPLLFKGDSDE